MKRITMKRVHEMLRPGGRIINVLLKKVQQKRTFKKSTAKNVLLKKVQQTRTFKKSTAKTYF